MAAEAKTPFGKGEAEGVSAEVTDSEKRELRSYMDEFGRGIDNVRMYERDRQINATSKAREIDREASFDQAKAAFHYFVTNAKVGGKIFR